MSLQRVQNQTLNLLPSGSTISDGDLSFVVMADTQLGLNHRYIEKKPLPYKWEQELLWLDNGINEINQLSRKPKFIMIVGDLIDAPCNDPQYAEQINDLKSYLQKIDQSIKILVLPGNHDIDEIPTNETIEVYNKTWGDDYYKFSCGSRIFLVVNSQLWYNSSNAEEKRSKQDSWVEQELQTNSKRIMAVFLHIPFYSESFDEPEAYFNLPKSVRSKWLPLFQRHGIKYVFSGHLHRNAEAVYEGSKDVGQPIKLVSTSSIGVQLGSDKQGFRICSLTSPTDLNYNYHTCG